jgi:hypothetical protein
MDKSPTEKRAKAAGSRVRSGVDFELSEEETSLVSGGQSDLCPKRTIGIGNGPSRDGLKLKPESVAGVVLASGKRLRIRS